MYTIKTCTFLEKFTTVCIAATSFNISDQMRDESPLTFSNDNPASS